MSALRWVTTFALAWASATPVGASCPPEGHTAEALRQLAQDGFAIADAASRQQLALALTGCLSVADPELRDRIAFEAYFAWLRSNALDVSTRRTLMARLLAQIRAEDRDGFAHPFAALVLAEIARTDRVAPWLEADLRGTLVAAAVGYLAAVRDYRGFDEREGWRHGVAHAADFALQLILNPAVERVEVDSILSAIAKQVAPASHFYIHGEPGRLARPVLYAAARGLHTQAEWRAWLQGLPRPEAAAPASQALLARRHNFESFVFALYTAASLDESPAVRENLLPALRAVLSAQ
jgi:hypothetical protein